MALVAFVNLEMLTWGLVLLVAMFGIQFEWLRRKERRAAGLPMNGFPILTTIAIVLGALALLVRLAI